MTIGVLEVARVASVERVSRGLDDLGARFRRLLHDGVDLFLAADVVTSVSSVGLCAVTGSPVSLAMLALGHSASRDPPLRSKKATAPYSNSDPTMPSDLRPRPSR